MPTVKDEQGNVVAKLPYDEAGEAQAEKIVSANQGYKVDYAPGGTTNAMDRTQTTYAGGGETGYNVPQYKEGGKARRQARRESRQERRNLRKIGRLRKKDVKITHTAKSLEERKSLKPTGKIRAGAKSVQVTKGGAYAAYGKKSAAAKSFRKAYASAAKGSTFTWDGRKYTKD